MVEGSVTFSPVATGLSYEEAGRFCMADGASMDVYQTLAYHIVDAAATSAVVFFRDGRHFHELDLAATGVCRVVHGCEPDTYEGTTAALGPDTLFVEWVVRGPKKQYTSTTRFHRVPAPR